MPDKIFIDTNIFIYAYTLNDIDKHNLILDFFTSIKNANLHLCASSQVLNEFYSVETSKYKVDHIDVAKYIQVIIKNFIIFDITKNTTQYALKIKEKYQYSWWDSLVLSSALENNCQVVYSEDMQHRQIIENTLKIVNPFTV